MTGSQRIVEANIGGDVSGQIAIGDYILQVGDINGGVVNIVSPAAKVSFDRRPRPVNLRPRIFPALLDRTLETEAARNALSSSTPVTVFGENGIGKTSLLRQIAHLPESKNFSDGVAYILARGVEMDDLLQSIFDAFHTSSDGQKPTDGQIRADLKEIQALIILDDLTLNREDAAFLLDVMPQSTFVLASMERILWGEGQAVALDGLPEDHSLELFERELGRTLLTNEKPVAAQICKVLLFHPLQILQTASLIREDGLSISEAFKKLTETRSQSPVLEITLQRSSETQKKILSLLAVAGGFVLSHQQLAALTKSTSLDEEIKALIGRGFVEVQGASFSLSGEAVSSLGKMWDLSGWEDALINHISDWLKTGPQDMLVDQVADTLFYLIKRAGEKKQWPHVVTLGRSLERLYVLRKKWQGWLKVLEYLRIAAHALADRKLEGWVLHQLGSRAMCMGSKELAQNFFKEALNIRRMIGDKSGMAVTQHNMNILLNLPLPIKVVRPSGFRRWVMYGMIGGVTGLVLILALISGIFFLSYLDEPTATPIPTDILPTPTPPDTIVPVAFTATLSATPIATATGRPAPIVLFDFIKEANLAIWESAYLDPDGLVLNDMVFYGEPQTPSPEEFANGSESPYVGWQEIPLMEEALKDELALLTYPYYSRSEVRGTYNLNEIPLRVGDRIIAKVGYKLLPDDIKLNSYYATYSILFYEKDPEAAIVLGELVDFYDGKVTDWTIQIPKDLNGKRGFFIFKVSAISDTRYDWIVWMDAALVGFPR